MDRTYREQPNHGADGVIYQNFMTKFPMFMKSLGGSKT